MRMSTWWGVWRKIQWKKKFITLGIRRMVVPSSWPCTLVHPRRVYQRMSGEMWWT